MRTVQCGGSPLFRNMGNWFIAAKKADFQKIAETFQISPVLARLIRNRDVEGMEAVHKYLYIVEIVAVLTEVERPPLALGIEYKAARVEM